MIFFCSSIMTYWKRLCIYRERGDIYICVCVCIYSTPPYTYLLHMLEWRKKGTVSPKETLGSWLEREGLTPSLLCAMIKKSNGFYKCFFFMFGPVDPTHECI